MARPKNLKGGRPKKKVTYEKVKHLREARWKWHEIAEKLDISRRTAINILNRGPQ